MATFYENLMRIGWACALYCDTTLYFSLHLVAFGCIFKKFARQDLLIFQEASVEVGVLGSDLDGG
jgi:hypothetical protein